MIPWTLSVFKGLHQAPGASQERHFQIAEKTIQAFGTALLLDLREGLSQGLQGCHLGPGIIRCDLDGTIAHRDLLLRIGACGADVSRNLIPRAIDR